MAESLDRQSIVFSSMDGLRLHAWQYGTNADALPVVCLPGLARTAADFDELATALATNPDRPRRVFTVDYRGRGLSAFDPQPANYDVKVESADIQALLTLCDIGRAAFIGTSRGGVHIMALAALRPAVIACAVLNDIGPIIETAGLMRVKSYVGKLPSPSNLREAANMLKTLVGAGFTSFTEADWLRFAERTFVATASGLRPAYDPALMSALSTISAQKPVAPLWNLFDGLAAVPLLVIRGANSDILSAGTLEAMRQRHPDLEVMEIAGQGHAPPLWETEVIASIAEFIARSEA